MYFGNVHFVPNYCEECFQLEIK